MSEPVLLLLVLLPDVVPEVELRPLVAPVALPEGRLDISPLAFGVLLSAPGFSAVPVFALPAGPPGVPGGLPAVEPPLMPAEPAVLDCARTDALAVANTAASAIAKAFDVISILDQWVEKGYTRCAQIEQQVLCLAGRAHAPAR